MESLLLDLEHRESAPGLGIDPGVVEGLDAPSTRFPLRHFPGEILPKDGRKGMFALRPEGRGYRTAQTRSGREPM